MNTLVGCEIILCDFNARIADRSCVTISFDENDEEGIVFEHDRRSHSLDTVTNSFGDKLLELCHPLWITILNGLFVRKGGEFTYVSHWGSSVVDYSALSDELIEINLKKCNVEWVYMCRKFRLCSSESSNQYVILVVCHVTSFKPTVLTLVEN